MYIMRMFLYGYNSTHYHTYLAKCIWKSTKPLKLHSYIPESNHLCTYICAYVGKAYNYKMIGLP